MFMHGTGRAAVLLLFISGWTRAASAQVGPPAGDLGDASLADLMKIEITSASHKEQRLFDTAAAVYVITAEDIRRSGLTSVPELLRLAPGVQVAQINGTKWAVSVRGFSRDRTLWRLAPGDILASRRRIHRVPSHPASRRW
jgi:iron complex outermembrane receptor protein